MSLNDKKDGVALVLAKQHAIKQAKIKKRNKRRFISTIIVTFLIISSYLYLTSSVARINYISITGNYYHDKNDIMMIANIKANDYWLITYPGLIKTKLTSDPMINDAEILKANDRNLQINIKEERLLAYLYTDKAYFVIENGELLEMNESKQWLIQELPLLVGFTNEDIKTYVDALGAINDETRANITEIHHYATSFDENMLKIIMIDGNKVYTSLSAISSVNNYFAIVKVLKVTNSCIYIDENSKTAYSSECPANN